MTNHPSSKELSDALLRPDEPADVHPHIEECLACRVRLARIAQANASQPPSSNTVQKIIDASTVVPGALALPGRAGEQEPQAGQLWRIGRDEALVAWVRENFNDGAVDVIPVVLDVELADEQTIIVASMDSPLPVDLAVMVALRTHVHRDAFINSLGDLDISAQVEEVIAATREGRESLTTVGPRIEHDDDDRIEYRQALRDLLAELAPSAWTTDPDPVHPDPAQAHPDAVLWPDAAHADVQATIAERLRSARCIPLDHERFPFGLGQELEALFKVVYLDTAVVVAAVTSLDSASTDVTQLVNACQRAAISSPDAGAICVAEPVDDWPCLLFSRASMRQALELPAGVQAGPVAIISGLGLVDTLWKHLEGAAPAWEVTESPPRGIGAMDVTAIAGRHAQTWIATIEARGHRAHQAPKKSSWTALPAGLGERVSRFVTAVAQSVPVEDALAELDRGNRRD